MNTETFAKMIVLIAVGLYEKEKSKTIGHYPYSNKLMHGINIFAAQALLYSGNPDIVLDDMHEAAFIEMYATKPVAEWFRGWNDDFVSWAQESSFWNTDALAMCYRVGKYRITDDCVDLINTQDDDLLNGMEQKEIYKILMRLSQKDYVYFRKFIITHPICSEQDLRRMRIQHADNSDALIILNAAYERVPADSHRCPVCGWTLVFDGMQAYCCNTSCSSKKLRPEDLEIIPELDNYRLRHGVMRYIALPGQLELQIQKYADEQGLQTELWPDKDQFDIGITFCDGTYWAIDAKTYRSPYRLKEDISKDTAFKRIKADQKFYVIPDELYREHPDYCLICNNQLERIHADARCLTYRELKILMKGGN